MKAMDQKECLKEYKKFNHTFEHYDNIINIVLNNKNKQKDRDKLDYINLLFNFLSLKSNFKEQQKQLSKLLKIEPQINTQWNNQELVIYGFNLNNNNFLLIQSDNFRLNLFCSHDNSYKDNIAVLDHIKKIINIP